MTLEQFLAWEAQQELRYEFDGFAPVAMTGGTRAHAAIQRNLAITVGGQLRGTPCQFFGPELKIEAHGRIRYPDGFVVCTPGEPRSTVVRDPVVIFEILSDSTAGTDRIVKNREYQAIASVRRYVMLEQDRIAATVFEHRGDDWIGHIMTEDAILRMPEIGIDVPLAELYADVQFAGEGEQQA
jgi:Uma2 family endonuclease